MSLTDVTFAYFIFPFLWNETNYTVLSGLVHRDLIQNFLTSVRAVREQLQNPFNRVSYAHTGHYRHKLLSTGCQTME
jgi:hypothetical protein